ncbi:MAG: UvrD-helicase domain-containing protein [Candidatus Nanoarchaeia archaeon]
MQSYHIQILQAMKSLEFNIGKTTLVSFLIGDINPTIERNRLDEQDLYGCLYKLKKGHIYAIIGELEKDELITFKYTQNGLKTLRITPKGRDELITPSKNYNGVQEETITINPIQNSTIVESDLSHLQSILPQFSFFTQGLNEKQQLSVLDTHPTLLTIAGAGSGKTTVLIKRIEFLVKFRGVREEEILAITFTTKARDEMRKRLHEAQLFNVVVHTFNSFCEQELRRAERENIEISSSQVLQFSHKIQIMRSIMQENNIQFEQIKREYFSTRQLKEKSSEELFLTFCYEIFSILDYSKNTKQDIVEYAKNAPQSIQHIARKIEIILQEIPQKMQTGKLRDFTDQILFTTQLYAQTPNFIPQFSHILVDEFQDINALQLKLIQTLKYENIFCVGDPRQSIYNWRGSDIDFIMRFDTYFSNPHIIMLEYNYRSNTTLVDLSNSIIKPLQLNDLKTPVKNNVEKAVEIIECKSQEDEFLIAMHHIKTALKEQINPNEIFVLARTNRTLEDFSKILNTHSIKFNLKSDDFSTKRQEPIHESQIILATIHAIKGQEAQRVIILDASTQYFPNKVQDNEFIAHVKSISSYDKFQEELRLFYVACTRAKQKLFVLYTGILTQFFPKNETKAFEENAQKQLHTFLFEKQSSTTKQAIGSMSETSRSNLKQQELKKFRLSIANRLGIQTHQVMRNEQLDMLLSQPISREEDIMFILGEESFIAKKYAKEIMKILQ